MKKLATLAASLLATAVMSHAQLNPGDIAVVQINGNNPDFAYVVAVTTITAGTTISITDNEWVETTPGFNDLNEDERLFTFESLTVAGSVVALTNVPAFGTSAEEFYLLTNAPSTSQTAAEAGFLFAIKYGGAWAANQIPSTIPDLQVAVPGGDSITYTGILTGTRADILAAITNLVNWEASGSAQTEWDRGDFTITDAGLGALPPDISAPAFVTSAVGGAVTFTVSSTDPNNDSIFLSASNLPAGATFSSVSSNGTVSQDFSWPSATPVGVYTAEFYASSIDGETSTVTEITVFAPPTNVSFAAAADSVDEDVGTYLVTVTKSANSGNVSGEIGLSGTATNGAGQDYTIDTTNFTMNGATTSATFTITVENDAIEEGSEDIILTLVNVTGGNIVSPDTFTLTILDDDAPPSLLFISEVADPGDDASARFVELYNAGGTPIDLGAGGYYIARVVNAATSTNDVALTGVVAAASTYVVAQESAGFSAAYPSAAFDQIGSGLDGNGDDGYFLFIGGSSASGTLIDAYGEYGIRGTNSAWEYTDSRAVRTDTVTQASTTWIAAEWIIPASADTTNMTPGVHPDGALDDLTNVSFTAASDTVAEDVGTYQVTVFKSKAEGNVSGEIALGGDATEGVGADYTIDATNFTMNGATTSAVFTLTVNNDTNQEPAESIVLTLANVSGGTIAGPSVFTLTILPNDAPPPTVWINEINYDDVGADTNEYVEVAGPAGTDLSNYQVLLYDGPAGDIINTYDLSGLIDDEGCGFGAVAFPVSGAQNGTDGVALADVTGGTTTLVQFLSYEGTLTGTDGPANGVLSIDIGTQTPPDTLQLSGTGEAYADFMWSTNTASQGDLNIGQTIDPCGGGDTTLDEYDVSNFMLATGTVSVTIAVTSNNVPYSLIYSTNILTDPAPLGTGEADTADGDGGSITLEDTSPADSGRIYWIRSNNDVIIPF